MVVVISFTVSVQCYISFIAPVLTPVVSAAHGTLNGVDTCVQGIVSRFLGSVGRDPVDASCLTDEQPPDFDGVLPATQSLSMQAFGTTDLWNVANILV